MSDQDDKPSCNVKKRYIINVQPGNERFLSFRQIQSTIEEVVRWLYAEIGTVRKHFSEGILFEEGLLEALGRSYDDKTSRAFFRSSYWYLCDKGYLEVNPILSRKFTEQLSEERIKDELSFLIADEYHEYIRSNFYFSGANILKQPRL